MLNTGFFPGQSYPDKVSRTVLPTMVEMIIEIVVHFALGKIILWKEWSSEQEFRGRDGLSADGDDFWSMVEVMDSLINSFSSNNHWRSFPILTIQKWKMIFQHWNIRMINWITFQKSSGTVFGGQPALPRYCPVFYHNIQPTTLPHFSKLTVRCPVPATGI